MNNQPLNNFIIIPDFALENLLTTAIKFLKKDYDEQVTKYEKLSYLYLLTHGVGIQRLNLFEEAKAIFFNTDKNSDKKVSVTLGWPETLKSSLNIIITHVGEDYAQNALGVDQGTEIYEEHVPTSIDSDGEPNNWRTTYARRYKANYRIIITGDNTNETIVMYHVIKSLLIAFEGTSHLAAMGFQNPQITGNDIEIKTDIIKHKFAKSIRFSFEYPFRTPDVNRVQYWNALVFKGIMTPE